MFMSLLQLLVPAQSASLLYLLRFLEMWLAMSLILAPLIDYLIVLPILCWSISLIRESPISRVGFCVKNSHDCFDSLAFSDAICDNRFAFSFRTSMHSDSFFSYCVLRLALVAVLVLVVLVSVPRVSTMCLIWSGISRHVVHGHTSVCESF